MNPNNQPFPPAPILREDTEHYQSAKGCFMLTLLILSSGVVCIAVGIVINLYIDAKFD